MLDVFLNKLNSPIYDKIELDVIIDNINTLLSCYDLSKNYLETTNKEEEIKFQQNINIPDVKNIDKRKLIYPI